MRFARTLPFAIALVAVLATVGMVMRDRPGRLANWPEFYRTKLSPDIQLPPEVEVVDYRDRDGFGHTEHEATFRLPKTRTPHEWIRWIVHHSLKQPTWGAWEPSGLQFSGGRGDLWYVRYVPGRDVYEAKFKVDF